jgi:hypothetical protein
MGSGKTTTRSLALWALGIPVAVVLVMGLVTTVIPPPEGGASADAGVFSIQLFAAGSDGGVPRLLAEFPGASGVEVRSGDRLLVGYRPNPRGGRVYVVDEKGAPISLPESGGVALAPGKYEVWALHDLSMTEAQGLEDAAVPWPAGALPVRLSPRAHVAQGALSVEP